MKLLHFLKGALYPFILFFLETLIFWTNYRPHTYLIGWDNVMPELNLRLNISRGLFSIWQDYRGLGTLDGMAHATNLIHAFYIGLLSIVFQENVLRYLYIHSTHLAGGIAIYFLILKLLKNKHTAFIGAVFYMLNLGVIQMYFAPLEVFATHFAALPIMALAFYNALTNNTKKSLFVLGIVSVLTSGQGFVPTVFITYLLFLLFWGLFTIKKIGRKRIGLIACVILITNAFWIIPFTYTAIVKSKEIQNTRINEFSSEEIYYRNHARGTLLDVLTIKGFMIDTIEYDTQKKTNVYFMNVWREHIKNMPVVLALWGFTITALIGIFITIRYRIKTLYPFLASFIISFIILANNVPVLSFLNNQLRNIIPLFGEAFRFPFTKFIILFAFTFSIFFALGISFIIKIIIDGLSALISRIKIFTNYPLKKIFGAAYFLLIFITVISILYTALPAFKGNFTSPLLRLSVPDYYTQTINYLNSQNKNRRILTFPMNSFWNWQYRTWGHRGSGFLWYGIEQPILDRAFDPWSSYNEQLFNEFFYAQSRNDIDAFDNLLLKYDISYILIDQTVINTLSSKPINYAQLNEFFSKSKKLSFDKQFGKIILYRVNKIPSFISGFSSAPNIFPLYTQAYSDQFLPLVGNYITINKKPDIVPFFPSLSTLKLAKDNDFTWKNDDDLLTFTSKVTIDDTSGYQLSIPSLFEKEFLIPIKISFENNSIYLVPVTPQITINGRPIDSADKPIIIHPQAVKNPTSIKFMDIGHEILLNSKAYSYLLNNIVNTIKITDGVNEELVEVDTSKMPKTPTLLTTFSHSKISSVSVSIQLFKSAFSINDIVKNERYKITKASNKTQIILEKSFIKSTREADGVLLEAQNDTASLDYYMAELFHQGSYAVITNTTYKQGLPINFYVDSPLESKSELETKFDKIAHESLVIIPPTDDYLKGYGFHFSTKSVGTEIAKAKIGEISMYPVPMQTINNIIMTNVRSEEFLNSLVEKNPIEFTQFANYLYVAHLLPFNNQHIVTLSQSYDAGWRAYEIINHKSSISNALASAFPFFFGKQLEHAKVNNWANGWITNSEVRNANSQIIIVYLPQYLEYAGFILLAVGTCYLIFSPKRNNIFSN